MNSQARIRKTPKGEEEIQKRTHRLEHSLRILLILVDGASTVASVTAKAAGMPDVEANLRQLMAQGFVEIDGESPSATDGSGASDVAGIKAALIGIARELLGSGADKVVAKLEAAPNTRDGLLEATSQCKKVMKLLIDEKKAEQFTARCTALLAAL